MNSLVIVAALGGVLVSNVIAAQTDTANSPDTKAGWQHSAIGDPVGDRRTLGPSANAISGRLNEFLDLCPESDPYYAVIRRDFQIRRNGVPAGMIPCAEPLTLNTLKYYSEELQLLQTLRFVYYMDMGQSRYLPWTPLRLYDWLKSKVAGINIVSLPAGTAATCCSIIEGRSYINFAANGQPSPLISYFGVFSIPANATLLSHEARHVDGFPHVSCNSIVFGCDQTYDERNLSPFGIQYYLFKLMVSGEINVGVSCLSSSQSKDVASFLLSAANGYLMRFVDVKPALITLPLSPGGICSPPCRYTLGSSPMSSSDVPFIGGMFNVEVSTAMSCGWTAASVDNWISINSDGNSVGSSKVSYSIAVNTAETQRSASLIVAGQRLSVRQLGDIERPNRPMILNDGIVDAWNYTVGITAGEWVSIKGTNFASSSAEWNPVIDEPISTVLNGIVVKFNGIAAPLSFVGPTQINAFVPLKVPEGEITVIVEKNGLTSDPFKVVSTVTRPAIYALPSPETAFRYYVTGVNAITSELVGQHAADPRVLRGARRGEVIDIYTLGLGPAESQLLGDRLFTGSAILKNSPLVVFGQQSVVPVFSAMVGLGLYVIRVGIPMTSPVGDVPIFVKTLDNRSGDNIFIYVE